MRGRSLRSAWTVLILAVAAICLAGCSNKFFDPTQIGRFRPVPAVNVILDSLGVADEEPTVWEGAEQPRPADVVAYETDYVFGSGDLVRVSIFELLQEGIPFVREYVVTETGKISIPEIGIVEVQGLTEVQLEEEIRRILTPTVLKGPAVTVILISSQKRNFSIAGDGIPRPSRYGIPRYDFRLLDALAQAGGISQFNISYVYVSRTVTGTEVISEPIDQRTAIPEQPEEFGVSEEEMLEIIAPSAQPTIPINGFVITSSEMVTDKELTEAASPEGFELAAEPTERQADLPTSDRNNPRSEWIFRDGKWVHVKIGQPDKTESTRALTPQDAAKLSLRETIEQPIVTNEGGRVEWVFQDGKWVPVQVGRPRPRKPVADFKFPEELPGMPQLERKIPVEYGWDEIETGGVQTRLLRIPADKLLGGDPRYNIVIRPGDAIHVPVDIIGEFCIMGNTNLQGYINITGRPMTLKMAIGAAGGLGPLAWPKRCEVIRRIGKNKEEIVMVDLDKIASGEQPDFFIKPNDLVNVGTDPTSRWRAVLRNAFRATYGFGFIYDRNFSDRDFGTRRPIPDIF